MTVHDQPPEIRNRNAFLFETNRVTLRERCSRRNLAAAPHLTLAEQHHDNVRTMTGRRAIIEPEDEAPVFLDAPTISRPLLLAVDLKVSVDECARGDRCAFAVDEIAVELSHVVLLCGTGELPLV